MAEIIADWQRAGTEHLNTYRRIMRLTAWSTVFLVVLLAVLAVMLL